MPRPSRAHAITAVACAAGLLAGCTPKQEEVSFANPCSDDVYVWLEDVAPSPTVNGQLVEAGATRDLTYEPGLDIVPVWVRFQSGQWSEIEPLEGLRSFSGEDLVANYTVEPANCES